MVHDVQAMRRPVVTQSTLYSIPAGISEDVSVADAAVVKRRNTRHQPGHTQSRTTATALILPHPPIPLDVTVTAVYEGECGPCAMP